MEIFRNPEDLGPVALQPDLILECSAEPTLPVSWGKLCSLQQSSKGWVTSRMKSYRFFIKIIPVTNPPY
jgi:hypothetical protein